jgi:hypothetical protein
MRSAGSFVATACDHNDQNEGCPNLRDIGPLVAYRTGVHPIEHLRAVARARGGDASSLVREAAIALGTLRADPANLVIASRRIVERHPELGPVWWLCARLLTSDNPSELAWELADEIDDDTAERQIALALPDEATVLTIGWPEIGGAALLRRGDIRVLCADSRHQASSFMQRLERFEVECDPIPAESLARAAASADLVVIEAVAASIQRVLAPIGSHVVAAVARSVDTPVWLAAGIGRRLPVQYVDAIADRVMADSSVWELDVDDVPLHLVTHVGSVDGVSDDVAASLRPDCPFAPELLRTSAM